MQPPGRIYTPAPLARHPLNEGLLLCLQGLTAEKTGGPDWFDDARNNGGTLTGGPLWTPTPRGSGLTFDGVNDYVAFGAALVSAINGLPGATVVIDLRCLSSNPGTGLLSFQSGGTGNNTTHYPFSNGLIYCSTFTGNRWLNAATPLVDVNTPHQFAVVANAGNRSLYQNGLLVGSAGGNGNVSVDQAELGFSSGSGGPLYGNLEVSGMRVYSRALSVGELVGLWDQSCRGHPDTLRRAPSRRAVVPLGVHAAAAGYLPPDLPHQPQQQSVMAM